MAMVPMQFRPGINSQAPPYENEGGWSQSNLVRFKDGFLQKLGGCQRLTNTPVLGTARGMHAWVDLSNNAYVGIGTNYRLEMWYLGNIYDITPQTQVSNLSTPLSTTMGSKLVTVTDAGYAPSPGDYVIISTFCSIGGIFLQGDYQVVDVGVGGANTYRIQSNQTATATVNGGGATMSHLVDDETGEPIRALVVDEASGRPLDQVPMRLVMPG